MASAPVVSVVIPCYNAALHLEETLASVRRQTLREFEAIAVDDGSSDGTLSVLQRHADWIRIVTGEHHGAGAARNAGTRLARGRYVQYLDADDLLTPRSLAQKVQALERTGADVAWTAWQHLVEAPDHRFLPGHVERRRPEAFHAEPLAAMLVGCWAPPAALLYRRELVDRIGGWREDFRIIQDARFLMDAVMQGGRIEVVDEIGACYRQARDASRLSRAPGLRFTREILANAVEIEDWGRRRGALNAALRQGLAVVYAAAARDLFLSGGAAEFRESLRRFAQARGGLGWSRARAMALAAAGLGFTRAQALARAVLHAYRRLRYGRAAVPLPAPER